METSLFTSKRLGSNDKGNKIASLDKLTKNNSFNVQKKNFSFRSPYTKPVSQDSMISMKKASSKKNMPKQDMHGPKDSPSDQDDCVLNERPTMIKVVASLQALPELQEKSNHSGE
ncbi:hypothetical protein L1987_87511 [Smallanthus sonchifolius]|nr:hypothetical protein L1987_87511 [Smallanthus sonchifolius]